MLLHHQVRVREAAGALVKAGPETGTVTSGKFQPKPNPVSDESQQNSQMSYNFPEAQVRRSKKYKILGVILAAIPL